MQEEWVEIPNFPGYEVSDLGRVRSFWIRIGRGIGNGRGWLTVQGTVPKILSPSRGKYGHRSVTLYDLQRNRHDRQVHRLVLELFVGPCSEGMEACHNSGDASENYLQNLRWDTRHANHLDAVRHGTNPNQKLSESDARQIKWRIDAGHSQAQIARDFGVWDSLISRIKNGTRWAHLR